MMDQNLKEQIELARKIIADAEGGPEEALTEEGRTRFSQELAERVLALNEWLLKGGSWPESWADAADAEDPSGYHHCECGDTVICGGCGAVFAYAGAAEKCCSEKGGSDAGSKDQDSP